MQKTIHFSTVHPLVKKSLIMGHLPHRKHKNLNWAWSRFHLKNQLSPTESLISEISQKKKDFWHSTRLSEIVLEQSIYPIETIKIRFGSGLHFTSENLPSQKTEEVIKNCKNLKFEKKNRQRYCIEENLYRTWC